MKRFALLSIAAAALFVPSFVGAEGLKFVYRPELRQWIAVPAPVGGAAIVTVTPEEKAARHEAMAHAYRGGRNAQAADHCDRMIKQAREAARRAR